MTSLARVAALLAALTIVAVVQPAGLAGGGDSTPVSASGTAAAFGTAPAPWATGVTLTVDVAADQARLEYETPDGAVVETYRYSTDCWGDPNYNVACETASGWPRWSYHSVAVFEYEGGSCGTDCRYNMRGVLTRA